MSEPTITNCPIYNHPKCEELASSEGELFTCSTCGMFLFKKTVDPKNSMSCYPFPKEEIEKLTEKEKGNLSRALFLKQLPDDLNTEFVVFKSKDPFKHGCYHHEAINHEKAWKRFISHSEIMDDLLLFLYDEYQKTNSVDIHPKSEHLNAISGGILTVNSRNEIEYVHSAARPYLKKMIEQGWINTLTDTQLVQPTIDVTMNFDGLLQCETIKEGKGNSRHIFVALQFGSPFETFYKKHLKPYFGVADLA